MTNANNMSVRDVIKTMFAILRPEAAFYKATIIFGIAISVLSLAIPISVQTLINTIANIGYTNQIVVLAIILCILLVLSGTLYACQKYVTELFKQRFYARVVSDVVIRMIQSDVVKFRAQNRAELMNRYFDIMNIQKNMHHILTGGFSLILQSIVGIILVSFYHPALLAFNIIFAFCVYMVWRLWSYKAICAAIELSKAKYKTAHWLEGLAELNTDYKAKAPIDYALKHSDTLTENYINKRRKLFRYTFQQLIGLLSLYAIFSAALLGLGGLLVVRGELSLGQLVAAEITLGYFFYGIARADSYLDKIYELIPAADKISHLYRIALESEKGKTKVPDDKALDITLNEVTSDYRENELEFNLTIPAGEDIMVSTSVNVIKEYFIDLVKGYRQPKRGQVTIGGVDMEDLDMGSLRDQIAVLDSLAVTEVSIEEYLQITAPSATKVEITDALSRVKLDHIVTQLPDGIQTKLTKTGYPLSASEIVRLKLASIELSNPAVIIITEHFDIVASHIRQAIFEYMLDKKDTTIIYFTNRRDISVFDKYLYLDWTKQEFHNSVESLDNAARNA